MTGATVNAAGRVVWLVEKNSPALAPAGGGVARTPSGSRGTFLANLSSDTTRLLLRNTLDFLAPEVAVEGRGRDRDAVVASNVTATRFLINGELNGAKGCYAGSEQQT